MPEKSDDIIPSVTVDALGLFCPLPVIKTERKLRKMQAGEVILVLSDDPTFPTDISNWCRRTGNPLLSLQEKEGKYKAFVRKM
jgi:tRNA 2-thiouridine synthesizing protein A